MSEAPFAISTIMPPSKEPVVQVKKLWSAFKTAGRMAIVHKDLDLTIESGDLLSIVGGSGSGKTVLLRQILGLEKPARGEVTVLGKPAARLGDKGAASRVGMLFQHGALFSAFTVLENIAFPLRELKTLPDALVRDAALVKLQMVGLGPAHAHKMPADLSGGMIKRVALARALALDPEIVFLDEPTSGLDPISAGDFDQLVMTLQRTLGLTVFMVTHDLDSLKTACNRIAVLGDRKVLLVGTMDDMLASQHPWLRAYFHGKRARAVVA